MKKYLILIVCLFALLLVTSCGSSKSSTRSETLIETGNQTSKKDSTSLVENTKKKEAEDVIEVTEEKTTVYDTDKPIDPNTGKHPVQSETTKTTKKESNKKKGEEKNTALNQSTAEQTNDNTKIRDATEQTKQKDETTVPKQIGNMIWALVVLISLVALVVIGWIIYKYRKKSN